MAHFKRIAGIFAAVAFLILPAVPVFAAQDDNMIITGTVPNAAGSLAPWTVRVFLDPTTLLDEHLKAETDAAGKFVLILPPMGDDRFTICATDAKTPETVCSGPLDAARYLPNVTLDRETKDSRNEKMFSVQDNKYFSSSAFYFTDRKINDTNDGFENKPADSNSPSFGTFTMNVSAGSQSHFDPNVAAFAPAPQWICCSPSRGEDAFTSDIDAKATGQSALVELRKSLEDATRSTPTILLFIHGFNTSFEGGAEAASQLSLLAGSLPHVTLYYSWPSNADMFKYRNDLHVRVPGSIDHLVDVLTVLTTLPNRAHKRIIVVAHSMGAHLLAEALTRFSKTNPGYVDSVILFAGDAAPAEWVDLETKFQQATAGSRTTLDYFSNADDVPLTISKCFYNGESRIGLLPLLSPPPLLHDVSNNVWWGGLGHYYMVQATAVAEMYARLLNGHAVSIPDQLNWLDKRTGQGPFAPLTRVACNFSDEQKKMLVEPKDDGQP
jgi:esterase/lipase superfamily enzyme